MRVSFQVFVAMFAVLSTLQAQPATGWKAGLGVAKITPTEPIWMAGYGSRTAPADGTLHELWVKAYALQDAAGNRCVVVSTDTLGIPQTIYNRVCNTVREKTGLERSRLMLCGSHTHCGPVLETALNDCYPLTDDLKAKIQTYAKGFEADLVGAIVTALKQLDAKDAAPIDLCWGEGLCRFAVNRRNNKEKEIADPPPADLNGPIDHRVPVVWVRPQTGGPTALLAGYACHNTTLSIQQWNGDYAGFFQIEMQQRHPGLTAGFFMGCGADQNPLPRRTVERCQRYGKQLADAVDEVLKRKDPAVIAPVFESAYEIIPLKFGAAPTREELQGPNYKSGHYQRYAQRMIGLIDQGVKFPTEYPYPVQVWRLGKQHWWIALGGEVVVDFSVRIQKEIDPHAIVTGYANDVMGYIPSLRVLKEGGYEGQTSMVVYGLPAHRWSEEVEEQIMASIHRLVSSIKSRP